MSPLIHTIGNLQSTATSNSIQRSSFERFNRESVEDKLYYLRDVVNPVEFDELVDSELSRLLAPSKPTKSLRQVFACLNKKLKRGVERIIRGRLPA